MSMENKKQTAVEWLVEQIENKNGKEFSSYYSEFLEQAKAMEKKQICIAWEDGDYAYFSSKKGGRDFESGEEYYNEIYEVK